MVFDDATLVEMLRRSYVACDGLWFVKAEEAHDLATAFDLDERVWEVMPKIQARKARELLSIEGGGLAELGQCFALKLASEGHEFEVLGPADGELVVQVTRCQWRAVLERAGRGHLGREIAHRVCANEGAAWAREFSDEISFTLDGNMCEGACACRYVFTQAQGERK